MDDNSNASAFLAKHYDGVSSSTNLGLKMRGIRGWLNQRDVNMAVQAGERMAQNIAAQQAIEDGDSDKLDNIVTATTGITQVKAVQGVTLEQVGALIDGTVAKQTAMFQKFMLGMQPKKRGRKANKP